LTYTQVAAVLAGKRRGHGVPLRLLPMLEVADRLRAVLEGVRSARGSIDFDLPEPQILLDVEGAMTGITIQSRNVAHRMVEAFMIAANEAVATHLGRQRIPSLFRVHDPPDPAKLDALAKFVSGFGLRLDVAAAQRDGPAPIQQMLRQVQDRQEAAVVGQVTLRSMSRARYDVENAGHFGLASESYCHFTSPIRRYPDLVVHRSLRRSRGARPAGAVPDVGALRSIAETSSETERRAEAAERELLAWKKVAFIERRIGDSFDGLVTGVTRFGLFVQLIDNLVEGLVRAEALGEEWFEFLPQRFELCGTRSGRTFRLGDRLRVRVDRADRVLQRVDLSLAEGPEGSAGSPPPRRRRAAARRCARPGGGSRPRVRRR
jgi:ribonuclease R